MSGRRPTRGAEAPFYEPFLISFHGSTEWARSVLRGVGKGPVNFRPREAAIRTFTVSLIGVAALAAGLVLIRQQRQVENPRLRDVPPGETVPTEISLDRLRELGY